MGPGSTGLDKGGIIKCEGDMMETKKCAEQAAARKALITFDQKIKTCPPPPLSAYILFRDGNMTQAESNIVYTVMARSIYR